MIRPQGMLFDMGGTLLEELRFDRLAGRTRVLELAHNPRGATLDDYAAVAYEEPIARMWAQRDETLFEFPAAACGRLMYERLGLTFDIGVEEVQFEFWKAAVEMRPQPGILEVLDMLRAKGLPLGVVGNCSFSGQIVSWELEKHGLLHAFEFVMSSADYGVRKPHPALFRTAAAKLGLPPEHIWFAGDMPRFDIAGATGVGMRTVWYNRRRAPDDGVVADMQIQDWSEFAVLLDAAGSV